MNISYLWLRAIVPELTDPPERIAERLAMLGAPVDELVELGAPLRDIRIARVVAVQRHPNADRLSLCTVDAGGEAELQVVCGAPNVKADTFYPFAPVGASLPGGITIRKAKIRGIESQGMLCSARELGLGRDHEGILELQGRFEPGKSFIDSVALDDTRIVIDVTPNRPDMLSHWGVARELAPAGEGSLVLPPIPGANGAAEAVLDPSGAEADGVTITVEGEVDCPRYIGVAIRGVTIGPSPEWLASRLRAIGSRPINNVVDATNYVLHELGQPLHAYDRDRLGDFVGVRRARAGETLVTLDGEKRTLSPSMLVITDATRPIALAGVMGGLDTEVGADTKNIFLECALFDPAVVRASRRTLGMSTDASYRYERGVDPDGMLRAVTRAARLIVATAGGEVTGVAADGAGTGENAVVELRAERAARVLGIDIPIDALAAQLEPIGFRVEGRSEGAITVRVPGHRRYDVSGEADLVEEVARRHGYDDFPDDLRPFRASAVPGDAMAVLEDRLRGLFVGQGFLEARSAAFAPETEGDVELALPLSSAESRLRRAITPGLLRRIESNFNRGRRDIRLFEIGTVFAPGGEDGLPVEETRVAAAFTGARRPPHWTGEAGAFDVWDLSGLLSEVASMLDLRVRAGEPAAHSTLTRHQSFVALDGDGAPAGEGGLVSGENIDAPAWAEAVWALEVRLDPTMAVAPTIRFRALPTQPSIERDLSLVGAATIAAATLTATIAAAAGELLERVEPFDVYEGAGIGAHERSMAFRLTFRAPDRTLTDREIDAVVKRIVHRLEQEHDVRQRG